MRCIHCGLPLPPTNTGSHCPRCHTFLGAEPNSLVVHSPKQYENQAWSGPGEILKTQRENGHSYEFRQRESALQTQSPPSSSSPGWKTNSQPNQLAFPPTSQTPFPQPDYIGKPIPTPSPPPTPAPIEAAVGSQSDTANADNHTARTAHSITTSVFRPRTSRPGNFGFLVAGMCVIAGGLILIFLYFMELGLPLADTTNAYTSTPTATTNNLPSPTATASSPTAVASATVGSLPGQQYIDKAQIAHTVNAITGQPLQTATTFKVNQKIYVTFNIHPNGKNGAVCLLWYLNNRIVTQYPFAVTATARGGYSYAVYGGAGQAYIEIYWATSTACTDKMLAQHVNFTVVH